MDKLKEPKKIVLPVITAILSAAFPPIFLYCSNSGEARFFEVFPAIIIFSTIGIIILLFSKLLYKLWSKAAIICVLFNLIIFNYSYIEQIIQFIIPNAKYWHIVPSVIFIIFLIGYAINHHLSDDLSTLLLNILCTVFVALTIFNLVISIPDAATRIKVEKKIAATSSELESIDTANPEKPNIYLFIFDEYAGFNQINEVYGYENAPLKEFLTSNKFSISYNSKGESIITTTVLTNLVNLEYVVDDSWIDAEKELVRKNGSLFTLMHKNGYSVQCLEATNFFSLPSPLDTQTTSKSLTASGDSLFDLCVAQTIAYPFYISKDETLSSILTIVNFLAQKDNLPASNTFTIVYIVFPHEPFLVDENGNTIPPANANNWKDKKYYLGQYKYATKLMIKMAENVLENDKDSIIMLQSDHGARASTDPNINFSAGEKNNQLNAVYYRGENLDIEGLSTLNTLKLVCYKLFSNDDTVFTPAMLPDLSGD